jgi:hypothetical protein
VPGHDCETSRKQEQHLIINEASLYRSYKPRLILLKSTYLNFIADIDSAVWIGAAAPRIGAVFEVSASSGAVLGRLHSLGSEALSGNCLYN